MEFIWGSLYKNYHTKNLLSKTHCIEIVSSIKNQTALHDWIEASFLHVFSKIQWLCMKPRRHIKIKSGKMDLSDTEATQTAKTRAAVDGELATEE